MITIHGNRYKEYVLLNPLPLKEFEDIFEIDLDNEWDREYVPFICLTYLRLSPDGRFIDSILTPYQERIRNQIDRDRYNIRKEKLTQLLQETDIMLIDSDDSSYSMYRSLRRKLTNECRKLKRERESKEMKK